MTPIGTAADLLQRFLDRHGRRRTFRAEDDLDVFHGWLRATDLAGDWRGCRALAGQVSDSGLLAAVAHEHPGLVAGPTERRSVLRDYEPGAILVRDPARPNPAELTRVRLVGLNLIAAVLRGDLATVLQLSPRSTSDGGFLAIALAELAAELAAATGRDPAELLGELRGQTIRDQATGGRP